MDYLSNKALLIGVALLVTMSIASAVLFTINQVVRIYGDVYNTDTSIQNKFGEFDMYDDVDKTAIDLLNTAKKYKDSNTVYVVSGGTNITNKYLGNSLNADAKENEAQGEKINTQLGINDLKATLDTGNKDENYSKKYKSHVIRIKNDKVIILFSE